MTANAQPLAYIIEHDCSPSVQLYQIIDAFIAHLGIYERCLVADIYYCEDSRHYIYKLIGLETYQCYRTSHVENISTQSYRPEVMSEETAADVIIRTAELEYMRQFMAPSVPQHQFLNAAATVVDYSDKCLVIFTSDANDAKILERIRAKRNPNLSYQGRKVAGWIFPKCRQEQLAAVLRPV